MEKRGIDKLLFLCSWKILWTLFAITTVTLIAAEGGIGLVKNISFFGISDWLNGLEETIPNVFDCEQNKLFRYLVWFVFVVELLAMFFKHRLKTARALIIRHKSLDSIIEMHDSHSFPGETFTIDLTNELKSMNLLKAIYKQDKRAMQIHRLQPEDLTYYSIASIPFVFRLGYQIGDGVNVRLLHKKRSNSAQFCELSPASRDDNTLHFVGDTRRLTDGDTKIMLVTVSTSRLIGETDVAPLQLRLKPGWRLDVMPENKQYGYDILENYGQLQRLREYVLQRVEEREGVEQVHLVMATSSIFAFSLGQSFSRKHHPKVVVYEYVKDSKLKYPWGISIAEKGRRAVIQLNKKSS